MFALENQQNRPVTFGFIKNRAYDFLRFSPKIPAKTNIAPCDVIKYANELNSERTQLDH